MEVWVVWNAQDDVEQVVPAAAFSSKERAMAYANQHGEHHRCRRLPLNPVQGAPLGGFSLPVAAYQLS